MDVLAEANRRRAAGHPVISMAVGQPADPAPLAVREAAQRALRDGRIGYTDALGLVSLREAIAAHYHEHYGVSVDPARIAVTTGSSAAFNLAFLVYFDPGDRVAITRPGYPAYRNILRALGLEVVEISTGGTEASLTAEALRAAHAEKPLKGVLFASPANPTGAVIAPDALCDIVETARGLGIRVISDEIYHRLSYEHEDVTALSFADDLTVINSFSKYYCMTGWRIGWMVVPPDLMRPVERLAQNLYISPPSIAQAAALGAFDAGTELEANRNAYAESRALLLRELPEAGFTTFAPADGAFYLYCDVSHLAEDSLALSRALLDEAGVAVTPGIDFDAENGHRFLRFSYAGTPADMAEAAARLKAWARNRR